MHDQPLHRVSLPGSSIDYFRRTLIEGATFSRCLLGLPWEQGSFWTYVPVESLSMSSCLTQGGVTSTALTEPALVAQVVGHLARGADHAVVFENAVARPSDPVLRRLACKYVTYRDEVLFVLEPGDQAPEVVTRTVRACLPYGMVGALTRTGYQPLPLHAAELSTSLLQSMAAATESVVVSAYDGEGFVGWSRSVTG